MGKRTGSNVRVMVRIRPVLGDEESTETSLVQDARRQGATAARRGLGVGKSSAGRVLAVTQSETCGSGMIRWSDTEGPATREFAFDACASESAQQGDIFRTVGAQAVDDAFEGYHVTVFAYGLTGSGKTHTMMGTPSDEGLIPRISRAIFDRVRTAEEEERQAGKDDPTIFSVRCSYMEIYNEKVRDLLGDSRSSLPVKGDGKKVAPYVEGLTSKDATGAEGLLGLIHRGNENRSVGVSNLNEHSSRSHAVFTIWLTQTCINRENMKATDTTSKINLVDLAGSERVAKLTKSKGSISESSHINQSLSTLAHVIVSLVENRKHIPHRDSTLTWVLKDALGGNSRTWMIATVSPMEKTCKETLSTLRYANMSRKIQQRAHKNIEDNEELIAQLKQENEELRRKLEVSLEKEKQLQTRLSELQSRPDGADESGRSSADSSSSMNMVKGFLASLSEMTTATSSAGLRQNLRRKNEANSRPMFRPSLEGRSLKLFDNSGATSRRSISIAEGASSGRERAGSEARRSLPPTRFGQAGYSGPIPSERAMAEMEPKVLVAAMQSFITHASVQAAGCRVISTSCKTAEKADALVHSGAVAAVVGAMKSHAGDAEMQRCGCWALRVLCSTDGSKAKIRAAGGAEVLYQAMRNFPSNQQIQMYARLALDQMPESGKLVRRAPAPAARREPSPPKEPVETTPNDQKRVLDVSSSATGEIVAYLIRDAEDAGSSAAYALWELGDRCLMSDESQEDVVEAGGVHAVLQTLAARPEDEEAHEAGCTLLAQLAYTESGKAAILAEEHVVETLVDAVLTFADSNAEIVVGCCRLFHVLASTSEGRTLLRAAEVDEHLFRVKESHRGNSDITSAASAALQLLQNDD